MSSDREDADRFFQNLDDELCLVTESLGDTEVSRMVEAFREIAGATHRALLRVVADQEKS